MKRRLTDLQIRTLDCLCETGHVPTVAARMRATAHAVGLRLEDIRIFLRSLGDLPPKYTGNSRAQLLAYWLKNRSKHVSSGISG